LKIIARIGAAKKDLHAPFLAENQKWKNTENQ
jgi:hypothetical protein